MTTRQPMLMPQLTHTADMPNWKAWAALPTVPEPAIISANSRGMISKGPKSFLATKYPARLFCLFTIAVVLVALIATDFSFRGADNHSMMIGVLLAGSYLLTAAWTYPDTIVMRLLGHHSTATWGRAGVVLVTAVGYGLGYLVGGPDMSLIFAFIGSAVANLVAFMLPAAIIYRRYP